MNRKPSLMLACVLCSVAALAQQSSAPPASSSASTPSDTTTVRGCLTRSRENFIVVEEKTGLVYALRGVGDKLNGQVGREVEVTGELHPGSIKTGVRSTKAGSNPSDTVHGVEGVPLQVADVAKDVRTLARHCKAADQQ